MQHASRAATPLQVAEDKTFGLKNKSNSDGAAVSDACCADALWAWAAGSCCIVGPADAAGPWLQPLTAAQLTCGRPAPCHTFRYVQSVAQHTQGEKERRMAEQEKAAKVRRWRVAGCHAHAGAAWCPTLPAGLQPWQRAGQPAMDCPATPARLVRQLHPLPPPACAWWRPQMSKKAVEEAWPSVRWPSVRWPTLARVTCSPCPSSSPRCALPPKSAAWQGWRGCCCAAPARAPLGGAAAVGCWHAGQAHGGMRWAQCVGWSVKRPPPSACCATGRDGGDLGGAAGGQAQDACHAGGLGESGLRWD
jgi:hypothetical protein